MHVLGVIPARGGSKGIPRKNLYLLDGIPLIRHTIDAALSSLLDGIIISTDDLEIAAYGPSVIRPKELASDSAPMVPVIQHAVAEYEKQGEYVDAVMTLQPTSPLRLAGDIDAAIEMFKETDSLVSVCEGIHPVKSYRHDGSPFLQQEAYDKHRHKCYTRNGAIFLTKRKLLDSGRLFDDKPLLYVMPKIRSIDIDDYEDLAIAEALLKRGG